MDGEGVEGEESEGKLEPLTEKQQNEVPTAVEVFGMDWVCYSSSWYTIPDTCGT